MTPAQGQRIGEYVLDEKIGAGTFGEVWRARHHVWLDQLVAVKIPTENRYLHSLRQEGGAIHGLVHPNIVRAMGFDPYAPTPYLAMEYVPGMNLRMLMKQRKLSAEEVSAILRQVLAGLGHAHTRGIIHRDMKPENVLIHQRALDEGLGTAGGVKVTDFGLGRAATSTALGSIAYSMSLGSKQEMIAGTLEYMSPEQRAGGAVDARTDLYACGVMLYEMLTGECPAGTEVPSDVNRSVPRRLDEVFRRAYARLEKRFASAVDFDAALADGAFMVEGERQCPRCGRSVRAGDQFCMYCGMQLAAEIRRCSRCSAYPDATDHYCIFCGQPLKPAAMRA